MYPALQAVLTPTMEASPMVKATRKLPSRKIGQQAVLERQRSRANADRIQALATLETMSRYLAKQAVKQQRWELGSSI